MKKMISKFLSGILAFSLMLFSVPTVVNGAEEVDGLVYRISGGGLIITDCTNTSAEEITIPERATLKTGMKLKVVGIDDYAFGYCNNLSVIHVPDTLKTNNMGNVAFLTAKSIVDFTNGELNNNSTMESVVKYVAKQIYDTDKFTDEEMNEITAKFMDRISKVDTSSATALEDKVMILIKNIDKMGLAPQTIDKFNTWVSLVKYSNMTIKGEAGTEIQQYVNGRSFLGLKYEITSTYPLAQENCNLYYVKLDKDNDGTYDSISITGYSGNIQEVIVPDKIDKLPVVDIAENAFSNAINLNKIRLPKTINSMGNNSVGFFADGTKIPGFIIYGYLGTFSERYALKNTITFKDLTSVPVFSQTEVSLKVGEMIGITIENYKGDVKWFSDDTTIATVSGNVTNDVCQGYIKGINGGEVTVYAELPDGTLLKCSVTIKATPVFTAISTPATTTTTGEAAISLTSKYTQPTITTTAEPAISLTTKYTQPIITTTAEPAISLTTKYTQPTTTSAKPISKQTTNSSVTTQTTTVTNVSSVSTDISETQKTTAISSTTTATPPITSSSTLTTLKNTTSTTVNTTLTTSSTSVTRSLNTTTSLVTTTFVSSSSTMISSITQSTTVPITTSTVTTSSSSTITQTMPYTTTINSSSTSATTKATTSTSAVTTINTSESTTTITTITPVSTVTTVSTNDDPEETKIVLLGDANDDGKVNVRDAAYIAKILSIGQDYILPFYSDFNQDEKINVRDAAAIARVLATNKNSYHWVQIIIKVRSI